MNHIRTRMEARRARADDEATLWAIGIIGCFVLTTFFIA